MSIIINLQEVEIIIIIITTTTIEMVVKGEIKGEIKEGMEEVVVVSDTKETEISVIDEGTCMEMKCPLETQEDPEIAAK